MRYLEWSWDPDPADTTYVTDFGYLLRDADGTVTSREDRHELGLFPRSTWLALLVEVGFEAEAVEWTHSEAGAATVFVGRRRG